MRKDFSTNVAISSKEVADSLFSGTKSANLVDSKDKKRFFSEWIRIYTTNFGQKQRRIIAV